MSSEYKRVRDYELMVIFHPELSEEDLVIEIGKVESHITAGEGTITLINRETPWGRRRLSYAIRHESRDIRDGVYVLYYFTAESSTLLDMEREIKLQDRILRYLLTQQTTPIMEPTPIEEEAAEAGATAEGDAAATADTTEATTDAPVADEPAAEAVSDVAAVEPETAEPAVEEVAAVEDEPVATEPEVEPAKETPVVDAEPVASEPEVEAGEDAEEAPVPDTETETVAETEVAPETETAEETVVDAETDEKA